METIREFTIDIDAVSKAFKMESGITHSSNKMFRLLPFAANDAKVVSDFKGVVGAFVRLVNETQLKPEFNKEEFLKKMGQLVEVEKEKDKEVLLDFIEKTFINEDELEYFNLKSMNYIKAKSEDEKVAKFLYSLLVDTKLKTELQQIFDDQEQNVLYRLIFEALPALSNKKNNEDDYFCAVPYVRELFRKDIKTLMGNQEVFKESIQRLLEYYYFFYVTQLAIKLNKFEKADLNSTETVFYTLSWESTSKKRQAYMLGWESLKKEVGNLFSHAVTLELLNYNNQGQKMNYTALSQNVDECDRENVAKEIEKLRLLYSNAVQKDLDKLDLDQYNSILDPMTKEVHNLFETVECQFVNSKRYRAAVAYSNWIIFFMQKNFGKRRGSLGYNLNLTEEDIIFFTKIITEQNEGRIRLNHLFEEFNKRGMYFDKYSTANIVELLEKLNLLEKKSDSGDAQYVRSIL